VFTDKISVETIAVGCKRKSVVSEDTIKGGDDEIKFKADIKRD
jgi:hypothetical protein